MTHDTGDDAVRSARSVVTVGNFDGVHRGHQRLISQVVEAARRRRAEAVVVTFDPHPLVMLRPMQAPERLTCIDHRVHLLQEHGIERVVVVPFTRDVSRWTPAVFVDRVLGVPDLGTVEVHVGDNFRFGCEASGDVQTLAELGRRARFSVDTVPLAGDTAEFSSSAVRAFLRQGDVQSVTAVLGRPHQTSGILRAGATHAERTMHVDHDIAIPPAGSYGCVLTGPGGVSIAARVTVRDRAHESDPVLAVRARDGERLPVPSGDSKVDISWHDRLGGRVGPTRALS